MSGAGLDPRQRGVLLRLLFAVISVVAILSGYILTAIANLSPSGRVERPATPAASETPGPTADSLLATPGQTDGIGAQVRTARVFTQIQHQVGVLRGLAQLNQIPLTFPAEEEMEGLLRLLYLRRGWGERLEPFMLLGLVPQVEVSIEARARATVYIPEEGQIYVANGAEERTADDQALVVHAYAHALQDQHFGLNAAGDEAATTDAALALEALLEGDATLVAGLYRYGDLAGADWDHLGELVLMAEQPNCGEGLDQDPAFDRLAHFPNWEGRQFVQALYESGGWKAIDSAYVNPPRSTEEILHPGRYGVGGSAPASVLVPDLSTSLGEEWAIAWQDTFGEFVMGLYLGLVLPEERAWDAVNGWSGDTFVLWEHEDGRRLWLWRSMWDSVEEAAEFESALLTLTPHGAPPVRSMEPPDDLPGHWYETATGGVHFSRVGRYVVWLVAPDVNTAANVAELLP